MTKKEYRIQINLGSDSARIEDLSEKEAEDLLGELANLCTTSNKIFEYPDDNGTDYLILNPSKITSMKLSKYEINKIEPKTKIGGR